MTLRKNTPLYDTVGTRPAAPPPAAAAKKGSFVGVRLTSLAIEIPPTAYVAITGNVPVWVRGWMIGWLSVWLLVMVVAGVRSAS